MIQKKESLLEKHISETILLPNILTRFSNYVKGVRTGSIHTNRAYLTNVFEYFRFILFSERIELPKDYSKIALHSAYLKYLENIDKGIIVLTNEQENENILIPYEQKLTGRNLELARNFFGKDFNLALKGNRFLMQYKNHKAEKLSELNKDDVKKIEFLCSVYDPGPPETREDGPDIFMDHGFFQSIFRRDRIGEFQEIIREKPNSERTVNRKLASLSSFIGFLILNERLLLPEDDPFYRKKRPVSEYNPQLFLTENQIDSIYSEIKKRCDLKDERSYSGKRDRSLFSNSTGTLMRASANCNLRLEDIDHKTHTIKVIEKGKKIRKFNLKKKTWDDLISWLDVRDRYIKKNKIKNNPYVFVTEKGNPMHYRCWHRILGEYSGSAKIGPVSPHDLRRGVAKIMYKNGYDIFKLQKKLGHKNLQTNCIYLDIMSIDEDEDFEKYNPFA